MPLVRMAQASESWSDEESVVARSPEAQEMDRCRLALCLRREDALQPPLKGIALA